MLAILAEYQRRRSMRVPAFTPSPPPQEPPPPAKREFDAEEWAKNIVRKTFHKDEAEKIIADYEERKKLDKTRHASNCKCRDCMFNTCWPKPSTECDCNACACMTR